MRFAELLPFVLLIGAFWLLIIRPMQRQKAAKAALVAALRPGAEVITTGGIHGTVVSLGADDDVVIEVADGVRLRFVRQAVAAVKSEGPPPPDDATGEPGREPD